MTLPEERRVATDENAAERTSVTELRELVLSEAAVPSPPRRRRWLLVASTLAIGLGLVFAVREVSRTERALAAEGAKAVRVVMYELAPGAEFRVPIEPDTDVFRVVVHATRRGSLAREGHPVRLNVALHGTLASRTEELVVKAPGSTERVTPEDRGLTVGDPIGVNIDVNGVGTGDLTLSLASIEGADRLLVRVYRREAVHAFDAIRRQTTIDGTKREHLARRAGELDWLDLEPSEQATLVGARWRKVGALGDSSVVSRAVALAPARPSRATVDEFTLGTLVVRPTERASIVAHGASTITTRANGHPSTHLVATVRGEDGSMRVVEGRGELRVDVERVSGVEIATDEAQAITIYASDPARVSMPETVRYWRATPERPAIVAAGAQPIVLRVSARRPVPRSGAQEVSFAVEVTVAAEGSPRATTTRPITTRRSDVDRYEGRDPDLSPTERAVFYVLVPARGEAALAPVEGAVDVHLAELDPRAPPQPARALPAGAEPPRMHEAGGSEWQGWVARRPTNERAFPPDAQTGVRVAHRLVAPSSPKHDASPVRVARPPGPSLRHDGALFARADVPFTIDVPGDGPMILPIRLFSSEHVAVIAHVDDAEPRRQTSGAFARVTLPRTMVVDGDVRSAVLLGDDLRPGPHVITFSAPHDAKVWVHLPWKGRPPHVAGARWIAGDFEP
jgi:hypothetical protein